MKISDDAGYMCNGHRMMETGQMDILVSNKFYTFITVILYHTMETFDTP